MRFTYKVFKTKQGNKRRLAQYVADTYGITLNTGSMFDIQVKTTVLLLRDMT